MSCIAYRLAQLLLRLIVILPVLLYLKMAKANKSMLENNYGKREKKRQKEAIWVMTLLTSSYDFTNI